MEIGLADQTWKRGNKAGFFRFVDSSTPVALLFVFRVSAAYFMSVIYAHNSLVSRHFIRQAIGRFS